MMGVFVIVKHCVVAAFACTMFLVFVLFLMFTSNGEVWMAWSLVACSIACIIYVSSMQTLIFLSIAEVMGRII
jgi:hypothetical protein